MLRKRQKRETQTEAVLKGNPTTESNTTGVDQLTTAAFLVGLSCRTLLVLSGFTAAMTAGCTSTAFRFGATLGDETTLTTDGFTFTLGLATGDRIYLISN